MFLASVGSVELPEKIHIILWNPIWNVGKGERVLGEF